MNDTDELKACWDLLRYGQDTEAYNAKRDFDDVLRGLSDEILATTKPLLARYAGKHLTTDFFAEVTVIVIREYTRTLLTSHRLQYLLEKALKAREDQ